MKTDLLQIDYNPRTRWAKPVFHGLLWTWFETFGLSGYGSVIGFQNNEKGQGVKSELMKNFPKIAMIDTVDFEGADINLDLIRPSYWWANKYKWVICQAVLEHTIDPVAVMKNLVSSLKPNGLLFLHTCGPGFKYHAHPIDCLRFYEDIFYAWVNILQVELIDIGCDHKHCFVLYKKSVWSLQ